MRSRREAVRKQRITFISILFVAMFATIGFIAFGVTNAQAAPAEPSYKYYTSIQLEKGDTLWNIANEYMSDEYASTDEYIAEVCALNSISATDPIHAGQYLTVPYYSNEYID